jgi:hypothetical protein
MLYYASPIALLLGKLCINREGSMPEWKFLTTQRIRVKRRVEIPPPGDLSKPS